MNNSSFRVHRPQASKEAFKTTSGLHLVGGESDRGGSNCTEIDSSLPLGFARKGTKSRWE